MSKLLWLGLALSSVVNAVHAAEGPQKDAPPKEGAQGAPTAAEVAQHIWVAEAPTAVAAAVAASTAVAVVPTVVVVTAKPI